MNLWSMNMYTPLCTFEHRGQVLVVNVDWKCRQALSGAQDSKLRLWDFTTGSCITQLEGHNRHISALVVDWHGRQALSGSFDCKLKLWDLSAGACVRTFLVRTSVRRADSVCAVSADWTERRATSCTTRDGIKVWNLDVGTCLQTLDWQQPICMAASLLSSEKRVVSGHSDKSLRLWHVETGKMHLHLTGHTSPVTAVDVDWS